MLLLNFVFVLTTVFLASGTQSEVKCPAPVSPLNGKALLTKLGTSVKYSCDSEFILKGSEIAICKEDQWFPEAPTCEPAESREPQIIDMEEIEPEIPPSDSDSMDEVEPEMPPSDSVDEIEPEMPSLDYVDIDDIEPEMTSSTNRPLFKWDNEEQEEINSSEKKGVDDDMMLSDEARVRRVIYPRRRIVTTAPIKVRGVASLEKEERKRSSAKSGKGEASVPSVVYVRRQVSPAKSWSHPYRLPYQAITNTDEENRRAHDEAMRYYYWASQHPRSASFDYYHHRSGLPLGLQLSESQMAWINGLQPELRDRYLKDLYEVRANGVNYLTYPDAYPWLSANAHYTRLPLAGVAQLDPSVFDYSCYRTERNGRVVQIHAPKLPNAVVRRYDKRQNRNHPRNDYLAAEYQCKAGYRLLDSRSGELYCSKSAWVGNLPVCVPKI